MKKNRARWVAWVIVLAVLVTVWQHAGQNGCVDVGNQKCPVTGRDVDGKSTYTHQGKRYNLCSTQCQEPFSQDPNRYTQE